VSAGVLIIHSWDLEPGPARLTVPVCEVSDTPVPTSHGTQATAVTPSAVQLSSHAGEFETELTADCASGPPGHLLSCENSDA
jgi:hypothetical protein